MADDNFIILQLIEKHIGSFCFSVKPQICNDRDSYLYNVEVVIVWIY